MCIGSGISIPSLRNARRKSSQLASYLEGGTYSIFAWYSYVHSRNLTGVRFQRADNADCRLWWLGWRDYFVARYIFLSNLLRVGRVSTPMRVSEIIPVAHKSPRINAVDLNRDLPTLPLDAETGVLGHSLDVNGQRL